MVQLLLTVEIWLLHLPDSLQSYFLIEKRFFPIFGGIVALGSTHSSLVWEIVKVINNENQGASWYILAKDWYWSRFICRLSQPGIRLKNIFPFSLSIGNKNSWFFTGPNGDRNISRMLNKVVLYLHDVEVKVVEDGLHLTDQKLCHVSNWQRERNTGWLY